MPDQPQIGPPHLFEGERPLFEKALRAGARRYMEFGLGGSTLLAVRLGMEQIVAVDSSLAWVETARAHPEIAPSIAQGRTSLLHADIGPVGDWGRPLDRRHVDRWPAYLALPWQEWARRRALPELVYVDGRFRLASGLSVALMLQGRPAASRLRLLLHDMSDSRPYYKPLLQAFEIIEQAGSLCLMRLRPRLRAPALLAALLEAQLDPR